MKSDFDINLPSIPGRGIKFKINDLKAAAFLAQQARFTQDKSLLTNDFVQMFGNFEVKKDSRSSHSQDGASTTAGSRVTASSSQQGRPVMPVRFIIPEYRKHLLQLQEVHHSANSTHNTNHNQVSTQNNPNNVSSLLRTQPPSYTFNKAQLPSKQRHPNNSDDSYYYYPSALQYPTESNNVVTDNLFFLAQPPTQQPPQQPPQQLALGMNQPQKPYRQSAVFRNQERQRAFSRIIKQNCAPGPGTYKQAENRKKKALSTSIMPDKDKKPHQRTELPSSLLANQARLKQVLAQTMNTPITNNNYHSDDIALLNGAPNKLSNRQQYMFVRDDRDRFGKQKYPIAPALNVPGPGAYNTSVMTIEDKSRKVIVVEEQRKLLKQLFQG